jgi:hypothetical protein
MHLGGENGKVAVLKVVTDVEVAVEVTKTCMKIDSEVVAICPPPVPVIVTPVVVEGAALETVMERTELTVPPDGGVTGLGLKPPVTPAGRAVAPRVTGALNPPADCTVTVT